MHHRHTAALALAVTSLTLAACGSDDETVATTAAPAVTEPAAGGATPSDADMLAVATTYAEIVTASYDASIASATELKAAIDAFVADPTDATLQAAKDQWLASRDD